MTYITKAHGSYQIDILQRGRRFIIFCNFYICDQREFFYALEQFFCEDVNVIDQDWKHLDTRIEINRNETPSRFADIVDALFVRHFKG